MCRLMQTRSCLTSAKDSAPSISGSFLVIVERCSQGNFAAKAPEFKGVYALGHSKPIVLKAMRNAILDYVEDCQQEDDSFIVPIPLDRSVEKIQLLLQEFAESGDGGPLSAEFVLF